MRREGIILLNVTLALVLMGVLIVFSASPIIAMKTYGQVPMHYAVRQVAFAVAGLFGLIVAIRFDYHHFRDTFIYRAILLATLAMLVLVLVPGLSREVDGGRRWLNLGGLRFQPSEFAKVAVVILMAVKLVQQQDHIRKFWRGFVPPMLIAALFSGLVLLERDLGIPVIIVITALCMMCVAGARWVYLFLSLLPGIAGFVALVAIFPHRVDRMKAFLDPWRYRSDEGLQLIQSLLAFARGSITGQGFGAGEQKLLHLPAAHTDFIFAVWAEEMGLIGSVLMVALFATLFLVGCRIALCAPDLFGTLLATGIVSLITVQALLNMGITTGLLPTKGLSLPFISAGGSGLMVNMALMGVLINVALQAEEPEPRRKPALAQ